MKIKKLKLKIKINNICQLDIIIKIIFLIYRNPIDKKLIIFISIYIIIYLL